MPHGTPDWGLVGPRTTTYGLDDMGELAARLGSPHLFDRRGDALWLTTFENGLEGCLYVGTGVGWQVHPYTGSSRQGAYSIALITGNAIGNEARLTKGVPLPVESKIGLEFSFGAVVFSQFVTAEFWWESAGAAYQGAVRYDIPNDRLEYLTAPAVWTVLGAGYTLLMDGQCRHTVKMVFDMVTLTYNRVLMNEYLFGALAMPLVPHALAGFSGLHVELFHTTLAAAHEMAQVDSVIVTQNEP